MADLFHFDLGGILTFVLGAAGMGAAYYVRTTVQLSSTLTASEAQAKIAGAEKRLEDLALRLIERIDAVKEAVVTLNVTLVRADERIGQTTRDIGKLETRMSALEDRCKACESQLIQIQRGPKAS